MNELKSERDVSFDVAKAIAIIAVVLGHCSINSFLRLVLYVFHLPLFFIISGYFLKNGENCKVFFLKQLKTIIIPYFCCSFIIILYNVTLQYAIKNVINKKIIFEMALSFIIQKRYLTLWFFAALLIGKITFWIIDRFISKQWLKFLICICLSIAFILYDEFVKIPLPWNIDAGFIALFFLYFGNMLKRKNVFNLFFNSTKKIIIYAIFFFSLAFGLFFINYWLKLPLLEMFYCSYGVFPLTIGSALFMSMAILLVCRLCTSCKILAYVGKNTVVVFTLHYSVFINVANIVINFLSSKGYRFSNQLIVLVQVFFVALLSVAVSVVVYYLHLDFIFGKKRNR